MARATVTSKGQITIPVRVREALGLGAGDRRSVPDTGEVYRGGGKDGGFVGV